MKNYTRLSNAITATPTRPGSEDNVSERQQGDSKRIKQGANKNYYAMFTKDKPEDKEEGIGTVDGAPRMTSLSNETPPRPAETSTKIGKNEEDKSTRKIDPIKITEKNQSNGDDGDPQIEQKG